MPQSIEQVAQLRAQVLGDLQPEREESAAGEIEASLVLAGKQRNRRPLRLSTSVPIRLSELSVQHLVLRNRSVRLLFSEHIGVRRCPRGRGARRGKDVGTAAAAVGTEACLGRPRQQPGQDLAAFFKRNTTEIAVEKHQVEGDEEQPAAAAANGTPDAGEIGAAARIKRHDFAVNDGRAQRSFSAASTSSA